ncbi:MAG: transcription termination/antitermination protein NusG [Paracoccaceae bacterium]
MHWYLLQIKPNAYSSACDHLKRQGFDVFLPLFIKTTKKNGKFLDTKAPLFPGYLFMGASVDPVPWKSVNGTRGVATAVTLDGIYRPISNHIIEGLQSRCNDDDVMQRLDDIVPGDRVKIERGPFADFICTVEDIQDDQRAWVLIDLLQQRARSEVSLNDLSRIH